MTKLAPSTFELALATEILRPLLSEWPAELVDDEGGELHFRIRRSDWSLKTVIFCRASLRNLVNDPHRAIKIEYLQRDLLRSAQHRSEYRYPRLITPPVAPALPFPGEHRAQRLAPISASMSS